MSHFSLYFKQKVTAELRIWSAQQNMRIGKAKMISVITIEVLRVLSLAKVPLCIGILQAPPEFMAILSTMSGTSAITLSGFALESSRQSEEYLAIVLCKRRSNVPGTVTLSFGKCPKVLVFSENVESLCVGKADNMRST